MSFTLLFTTPPPRKKQGVRDSYPHNMSDTAPTRGTTEGWPLLTVESELNGDSKSTNERVPLHLLVCGAVLPVQEIFVLPWLSSQQSTKYFFSPCTI